MPPTRDGYLTALQSIREDVLGRVPEEQQGRARRFFDAQDTGKRRASMAFAVHAESALLGLITADARGTGATLQNIIKTDNDTAYYQMQSVFSVRERTD